MGVKQTNLCARCIHCDTSSLSEGREQGVGGEGGWEGGREQGVGGSREGGRKPSAGSRRGSRLTSVRSVYIVTRLLH